MIRCASCCILQRTAPYPAFPRVVFASFSEALVLFFRNKKSVEPPPSRDPGDLRAAPHVGPRGPDALAASLTWLAAYHGRAVSREALLGGLPILDGRLSVALYDRAARRAGLETEAVKRSIADIPAMVLPAVLIMKDGSALLMLAIDARNESVKVLNPVVSANTPQLVRIGDLAADYTGYAFFVRAAAEADARAVAAGDLPRNHWFWSVVKTHWRSYGHIALGALLVNMLALATPLFTMSVYDRVIPNGALPSLIALSIGMGLAIVFDFVLRVIRSRMIDVTGKNRRCRSRRQHFRTRHGRQDGAASDLGRNYRKPIARLRLGARILHLRKRRVRHRSAVRHSLHRRPLYHRRSAGMDSRRDAAADDPARIHHAAAARPRDEAASGRVRRATWRAGRIACRPRDHPRNRRRGPDADRMGTFCRRDGALRRGHAFLVLADADGRRCGPADHQPSHGHHRRISHSRRQVDHGCAGRRQHARRPRAGADRGDRRR